MQWHNLLLWAWLLCKQMVDCYIKCEKHAACSCQKKNNSKSAEQNTTSRYPVKESYTQSTSKSTEQYLVYYQVYVLISFSLWLCDSLFLPAIMLTSAVYKSYFNIPRICRLQSIQWKWESPSSTTILRCQKAEGKFDYGQQRLLVRVRVYCAAAAATLFRGWL